MRKYSISFGLIIYLLSSSHSYALPPPKYVEQQKEQAQLVIMGYITANEVTQNIKCAQYRSKSWCNSNPFNGYYSSQPLGVDGQIGFVTIKISQIIHNSQPAQRKVGDTIKMKYSIAPASIVGTWLNSRELLSLTSKDLTIFWLSYIQEGEFYKSVAYGSVKLSNK